jgi:uncharacterized protein YbjT (DUF2867 family)
MIVAQWRLTEQSEQSEHLLNLFFSRTVNTAAVARHHGVEAFVNMSQMTVTQMSITESTDSPQHKLHWLAEQAFSWSGLPVVTMRPTVFLDGSSGFSLPRACGDADELALPMGGTKTSPISGCGCGARRIGRPRGSHAAHRPDLQSDRF